MNVIFDSFGFLWDIELTLPLGQILLFAALASVCLILGKYKIGLVGAYALVFYWVFFLRQEYFLEQFQGISGGTFAFGALGLVAALIGFIGILKKVDR